MKPQRAAPANARALAARAISRVLRGRSLDDALKDPAIERRAESAFIKALVYGVLREHSLLTALAAKLLDKPLQSEPELHALLLCGLYQLRSMDVAAHAVVHETVGATAALGLDKASGLVNAVLRRFQREHAELEAALPADPALRYSHPNWLVQALRLDWPKNWETVLAENNRQGPLGLRVNRRALSREEYLERLSGIGIGVHAVEHAPDAVVLDAARPVERIPGFKSGQVSVQDASAQLAAELLQPRAGERVLDACAAPGGKTAHLLERYDVQLTALDKDPQRLIRIDENLRRLKLEANLIAADAADTARWWDGKPFDRILLDAPCSGTGVIRRHPDIKWLRRDTDIAALAATQLRLLRALWPTLKPGGTLVYATCSILQAECDEVIGRFRMLAEGVKLVKIDADWGEATAHGRRIAPGGDFDGFYYAVLTKS